MKRVKMSILVVVVFMMSAASLRADDGWVVVNKAWTFEQGSLMALGSEKGMDDPSKMAEYFFGLSLDELLAAEVSPVNGQSRIKSGTICHQCLIETWLHL